MTAADFICLLVKIPVLISGCGSLLALTDHHRTAPLPGQPEAIFKDVFIRTALANWIIRLPAAPKPLLTRFEALWLLADCLQGDRGDIGFSG